MRDNLRRGSVVFECRRFTVVCPDVPARQPQPASLPDGAGRRLGQGGPEIALLGERGRVVLSRLDARRAAAACHAARVEAWRTARAAPRIVFGPVLFASRDGAAIPCAPLGLVESGVGAIAAAAGLTVAAAVAIAFVAANGAPGGEPKARLADIARLRSV
eukprot:2041301-Prymnesium_polylepis.1